MPRQPIALVDAFADGPFSGNPAGVCLLKTESFPPDDWMQSVATEMNQAETAFVAPLGEEFALRWFTPGAEVDLCGHATLAAAHWLWESGKLPAHCQAKFHTLSGILVASLQNDLIELDFPAEPPVACDQPESIAVILGREPIAFAKNRLDYFAELPSEDEVRALTPDIRGIAKLLARGLIVTARGTSGQADIVSRCFFPSFNIDEDPVTGSAHCGLAPYWHERLGDRELTAYQASRRGGTLRIRQLGNRVLLRGKAVTTLIGELLV